MGDKKAEEEEEEKEKILPILNSLLTYVNRLNSGIALARLKYS